MGIRRVKVGFRNVQQAVFHDGETVDAEVVVEISEPQRARQVQVLILGLAHCDWSQSRRRYRGRIAYLNEAVVVWQPAPGPGGNILPTGEHKWCFSYRLPAGLPSSCILDNGGVTYSLKATVDVPWGFDETAERNFTVIKRINISTPQLQISNTLNAEKNICCCCCASGPVTLRATINKKGFRCGDHIEVAVQAHNQSTSNLGSVRVSLVQRSTLQVQDHTTSSRCTKAVVRTQVRLDAGQDLNMQGIKLKIPRCYPTTSARVVFIEYSVQVAVEVPQGLDLCVNFPIVIGTMECSPEQAAALMNLVGQIVQEAGRRAHIRQGAQEEGLVEVHDPPPAYNDAMDSERQRLISAMY